MDAALAIGRIVLVTMFIFSGLSKLLDISGTAAYIASTGLPFSELLAAGAGLVEITCGLLIVLGWQARLAATGLIVFTAMATVLFHDFWNLPSGGVRMNEMAHAWKNFSVIGGLMVLAAAGPGRWSVDGRARSEEDGAGAVHPLYLPSSRGSRANRSMSG